MENQEEIDWLSVYSELETDLEYPKLSAATEKWPWASQIAVAIHKSKKKKNHVV